MSIVNFLRKIFKMEKKEEAKRAGETDSKEKQIKSPIEESVLSYLTMKTTGSLMLTGDWGSGKTYHIKKYIFPLIEKKSDYIPIIVSLYGETNKNNIAQKVLFAYFDNKGKDVNLSTGKVAKNIKNFSEAIPYIKKFVDVEKLIVGTGENILRLIPQDKLLICFDDIERMSEEIKVDDFLGLINDLVENKGCKVLLIANEAEIKDGITFKEKTIEKTIHFIPNLSDIFDSITSSYPEGFFKSYLLKNKDLFIETLSIETKETSFNEELKKAFSNIRTLKFALEHFKVVFSLLVDSDNINDLVYSQLRNLWIFTLSVSIEFRKPNNINFTERKNLDSQTSTLSDLDLSNVDFLLSDIDSDETPEVNELTYSEDFKEKYYNRLSENYIYYEELYSLITSGKKINEEEFKQTIERSFKVTEGKVNPAHEILNSFLTQGYWKNSDEEFVIKTKKLLDYCEEGKLEDVISYLNAAMYIIGFCDIIEINKDTIVEKIKTGLDLFLRDVPPNSNMILQVEMVQHNFTGEHLTSLVEFIKQKIRDLNDLKSAEKLKRIQSLFESNLSAFVKEFLPERYDIRTPNQPFFHNVEIESVRQGINNSNPEGLMDLTSLLDLRYLDTTFSEYLTQEISFLNIIEEAVLEIDYTKKSLTNHILQNQLKPKIIESKKRLQEHIDKKAE